MMGLAAVRILADSQAGSNALDNGLDALTESERRASVTQQSKTEKRQITRNRTSYSCQTCRRRKVKCDKEHPVCGGCRKANEHCIYGNAEPPNPMREVDSTTLRVSHGAKRKPSIESLSRPSAPSLHSFTDAAQQSSSLCDVEEQLARLTSMIEGIRKRARSTQRVDGHLTPLSNPSKDQEEDRPVRDSQSESSSQQAARSRSGSVATNQPMLKDSFSKSIADEINQLHTLMRGFSGCTPASYLTSQSCDEYFGGCSNKSAPQCEGPNDSPISFHQAAHEQIQHSKGDECQLCSQRASDKSIFLQGGALKGSELSTKLDINAGLPTESQSNVLFRSWLTAVYTALPFLPVQQVFRKYREFWQWKQDQERNQDAVTESADIYFLAVLNVIWYSGSLSLSLKGLRYWFPGTSRAMLAAHFHHQTVRYMRVVSFPQHARMPTLGALVMLQSIPGMEEEPLQTSAYVNLMVRLAQIIGLHRELTPFLAHPREAELRRRMWWQIVQLDTSLAISGGHNTYITEGSYDTRMISEVKETLMGSSEAAKYHDDIVTKMRKMELLDQPLSGQSNSIVSVFPLVAKGAAIVALALRKVVRIHLGTKAITKEDLKEIISVIGDAEAEVKEMINTIPAKGMPELGFTPDPVLTQGLSQLDCDPALGDAPTDAEMAWYIGLPVTGLSSSLAHYHRKRLSAHHSWARITLSLMCDKLHCVTYAPFLKNARSKLWGAARQCALHYCHAYMRKFCSLATDPSLEPFRWSWPGMHQPMHAAMIILVDLYERPDSVEAPRSRALIDKVFFLSAPNAGIIGGENGVSMQRPMCEGGVDAFDMLRDLRNTTWRKAGLDPDFLWTEDDQVLVGVAQPLTEEQKIAQSMREDSIYENKGPQISKSPDNSSVAGMRYAFSLIRNEISSSEQPDAFPYANSDSDPLWSQQKPSPYHLARFEGQKAMPFPFKGQAQACPSARRHNNDLTGDGYEMLDIFGPKKPTDRAQTGRDDQRPRENGTYQNGNDPRWTPEQETNQFASPAFEPSDTAHHALGMTAAQQVMTPSSMTGKGYQWKHVNGDEGGGKPPRDDQDVAISNGTDSGMGKDSRQTENDDLGFDWERWDAVFGQYAGFTDIMEDVTWGDADA